VWLVVLRVPNEGLHLVVDAAWLARVARRGLKGYAGRAVRWQLEVERVRVLAELLDQPFLEGKWSVILIGLAY
jgi:hypothetical protein